MGDLIISGSSISAQIWGVQTQTGFYGSGTMGNTTISDSRISAPWPSGVHTIILNGTMGGMGITGAAGNITGGASYNDIERLCYTGATCTGPLTVDGAAMPETTETDGYSTWQEAVWNNP